MGGVRSMREATARRARATLQDSSVRETAKRNATLAASNHSSMATAPQTAIVIRRFMSGRSRRNADHAFGRMHQRPAKMPRE